MKGSTATGNAFRNAIPESGSIARRSDGALGTDVAPARDVVVVGTEAHDRPVLDGGDEPAVHLADKTVGDLLLGHGMHPLTTDPPSRPVPPRGRPASARGSGGDLRACGWRRGARHGAAGAPPGPAPRRRPSGAQ